MIREINGFPKLKLTSAWRLAGGACLYIDISYPRIAATDVFSRLSDTNYSLAVVQMALYRVYRLLQRTKPST